MTKPRTTPAPEQSETLRAAQAAPQPGLRLWVCGLNHVRAALEVREQYALDPVAARGLLRNLQGAGAAQALVLSTCNRTELYAFSAQPQFGHVLRARFLQLNTTDPAAGPPPIYEYEGAEAVRHLFAVGAGLDSLILGENQIKQQLQLAWEQTQTAGAHGPELRRLIDAAHRSGKRIRTETSLNVGTLDIGKAAVLRGEQALGGLTGKRCLLIGVGAVGRIAARALAERAPQHLYILNRTRARAEQICAELRASVGDDVPCEAFGIERLAELLPHAEFILGAAYAPELVIDWELYSRAAAGPDHPQRVCMIDAAVPRIFDTALGRLPWVELLDIEHMSEIVEANRQKRTAAAQHAWKIVEEETERYRAALLNAELAPSIQRLTAEFDNIFAEELLPVENSGGDASGSETAVEQLQGRRRRLKQRLLHEAIAQLKAQAEQR